MSYHVKIVAEKDIAQDKKVDGMSYPPNQSGGLEEPTAASGTDIDVQSKMLLLSKQESWSSKLPKHKKYRVVLIQTSSKEGTEELHELCVANEYSTTKEAFNKLNSSLAPLLNAGTVLLTKSLLKEIIVPRPLHAGDIGLHLIEAMEKDSKSHPEWLTVIQAITNDTSSTVPPPGKLRKEYLSSMKKKLKALVPTNSKNPPNEKKNNPTVGMDLLAATVPSIVVVPKAGGKFTDDEESNKVWTLFRKGTLRPRSSLSEDQKKTWLMDAVERQYLKSCMNLVLSRVDTNDQHPSTGDTALHIAVRLGNLTLVKLLLAYKADQTIPNAKGETPFDAAKKLTCKNASQINEALETVRKLQVKVKSYKKQNSKLPRKQNSSETFLLSLDGGGMRSVIMCHILAAIEARMEELSGLNQPLQTYFDYIAGTSAGAIVSALLLYKSMSIQLAGMYLYKFMIDVFARPKTERSNKLKDYITDIVGENTVMSDLKDGRMIITSTIANVSPNKLHLMTSYGEARDGQKGPKERKVWEALLATSAAPTYFPSFENFLDGGLMANNPTLPAMADIFTEAKSSSRGTMSKRVKLGCVVSLGTGYSYPPQPVDNFEVFVPGFTKDIAKSLYQSSMGLVSLLGHFVEQTTQSNGEVVRDARAWCDSIGAEYFRLSPPLKEDLAPDMHSAEELVSLLYETELYVLQEFADIDKIAKVILSK